MKTNVRCNNNECKWESCGGCIAETIYIADDGDCLSFEPYGEEEEEEDA